MKQPEVVFEGFAEEALGMGGKAAFTLPPLPYGEGALEPHISARTLSFHYGKHHKAYVDKLNGLAQEKGLGGKSLEEILRASAGDPSLKGVFNNAAQAWNHAFYWNSMKPGGGGQPGGKLGDLISAQFSGAEELLDKLSNAAATHFGSGWAWVCLGADGKLEVVDTHDADNPLVHGKIPLLTVDVWEHAYYLDYQNRRPDYVAAFVKNLINWDFAEKVLARAGL